MQFTPPVRSLCAASDKPSHALIDELLLTHRHVAATLGRDELVWNHSMPAYLPPEVFHRRRETGELPVPNAPIEAVMAGRTLWEVATGMSPEPGAIAPEAGKQATAT